LGEIEMSEFDDGMFIIAAFLGMISLPLGALVIRWIADNIGPLYTLTIVIIGFLILNIYAVQRF
jgi:hypothetical protein